MALRLARQYHEERGDTERWRFVSPAQAYHGATVVALGLTGRLGLQAPHEPYLAGHVHIPPSTTRSDPSGEKALEALDRVLEDDGDLRRGVLLRADQRRRAASPTRRLMRSGRASPRGARSTASSSASTRSSPASAAPGRGSRPTRFRSSLT